MTPEQTTTVRERAGHVALGYSPQIDTLRALAVGAVLYTHFWAPDTAWGHWGVRLFFVISGYLITAILLKSRDAVSSTGRFSAWKTFYIRRAIRLFPAYYLMLVSCAIFSPAVRDVLGWHLLYGSNILFALENDWGVWFLAHLWSLSVEEQFYLIWPFVILLVPRGAIPVVLVLMIGAAVVFRIFLTGVPSDGPARYVLMPAALDALGGGAILAWLDRDGYFTAKAVGFLTLAGAAVIAWFALRSAVSIDAAYVLDDLLLVIPMAAAVMLCRRGVGGPVGHVLNHSVPQYLGRISYGIYLFHFPALALVFEVAWASGLEAPPHGPVLFLSGTMMTLLFAVLSWHCVEAPANRLKDRFTYRESPPPPKGSNRPVPTACQ